MTRSRFGALIAVLSIVSVVLLSVGVVLATKTVDVSYAEDDRPTVELDGTLQGFFNQNVTWRPCKGEAITSHGQPAPKNLTPYECAQVQAPLDWNEPDGETLTLSLAVHRSGKPNAPALFFNLGGPGGPAVSALVSQVRDSLGDALVDNYDIVAMDPRGVGTSTPVQCLTDQEQENFNAYGVISDEDVARVQERNKEGTKLTPEEEIAEAQRLMEQFGAGCRKHSGDIAAHIDTPSVARDLDMLRQLFNQEKLNYLGYSYGTFLGATYADLFPSNVGRMVLDAAVDPAMNISEISNLQLKGFDESLKHWIEDCQASATCPLSGDLRSGINQINDFLDRLDKRPLPTSDPERPLTKAMALNALIGMMYSEETYGVLTTGMTQALSQDDGSVLLRLVDFLSDRNEDGSFASNSAQALIAVNSLDYPAVGSEKDWKSQAMQLRSDLDIMGEFVGYDSAGLAAWPFPSVQERKPLTAEGAAPIVVIGQTHDPATPYVMAQNLAGQLRSGVLVTQEGWSHGAYSKRAGQCIIDVVETYFTNGDVPENGLTCK